MIYIFYTYFYFCILDCGYSDLSVHTNWKIHNEVDTYKKSHQFDQVCEFIKYVHGTSKSIFIIKGFCELIQYVLIWCLLCVPLWPQWHNHAWRHDWYNSPVNISKHLHIDLELLTTSFTVSQSGSFPYELNLIYINTHICTLGINTETFCWYAEQVQYLLQLALMACSRRQQSESIPQNKSRWKEKEDCNWVKGHAGVLWCAIISKVAPNSDTSISVCPSTLLTSKETNQCKCRQEFKVWTLCKYIFQLSLTYSLSLTHCRHKQPLF